MSHSDPESLFKEGLSFSNSDPEKAFGLFSQAAGVEGGHAKAEFNLALAFEHGRGVVVDLRKAVHYYQLAADKGHSKALVNLGLCYQSGGRGVAVDLDEAARLYERAMATGNKRAACNLGVLFEREGNLDRALECYVKAADQGDEKSMCNAGLLLKKRGDVDGAVRWFKLAADLGNVIGSCNLGLCHLRGEGVPQSEMEGRRFLLLGAEGGLSLAQYNLAVLCADQTHEDAEAVKWFEKAAEQGHVKSMLRLAIAYETGSLGLSQDTAKALEWYDKAAESRSAEGVRRGMLLRMREVVAGAGGGGGGGETGDVDLDVEVEVDVDLDVGADRDPAALSWSPYRPPRQEDIEICSQCGRPGSSSVTLLRCGRCGSAIYCSKECQRAAWRSHQKDCE